MRSKLFVLWWVVLLGSLVWGQEVGTARVGWVVAECWVTLRGHAEVDLGMATSEVFLSPGYLEDAEGNELTVLTNCWNWVLTASLSWTPPAGHREASTGPADFLWWVVEVVAGEVEGWQAEPRAGDGWVATGRGPGVAVLSMGYRYNLDPQDVPGEYQLLITYTLTGE